MVLLRPSTKRELLCRGVKKTTKMDKRMVSVTFTTQMVIYGFNNITRMAKKKDSKDILIIRVMNLNLFPDVLRILMRFRCHIVRTND